MKQIDLSALYGRNYGVNVLNSHKQFWDQKSAYSCFGRPKDKNMLLYLDGLRAEYTLRDGTRLLASDGDLVYSPVGSEYSVRFYDKKEPTSCTVGTNFLAFDEEGAPFVFSDSILVFRGVDCKGLITKVNDASEAFAIPCYSEMKAAVYDLLTLLTQKHRRKAMKKFKVIEKGIDCLEGNDTGDMGVRELAALCNVSEIYFRRLFKEYSGLSPTEYRIRRRLEKAKNYLAYDDLSVAEIAELLGFVDTAYFCKQFKAHTGVTPMGFQKGLTNADGTADGNADGVSEH